MGRQFGFGAVVVLVGLIAGVIFVFGYRPIPAAGPVPAGVADVADSAITRRATEAVASVRRWVDEGRVPGAVLSVRVHGRVVTEVAFGDAHAYDYAVGQYFAAGGVGASGAPGDGLERRPDPTPMTVETVFDLASVTKVMATTTAVAVLVDRGLVRPEAPVRTYLPDFTGGGRASITVAHLLTHTSGLPQWLPVYYHAQTPAEAYAFVRGVPLAWPVGAERHYSDLGFMVLGRLVEAVAGARLDAYLTDEVYAPLDLTSTGFRPPDVTPAAVVPVAATSHGNPFEHRMVYDPGFGYDIEDVDPTSWDGWRRRTLVGEVNDGNAFHAFGGVAGHAGLFSSAGDLQRLLGAWLGGGAVDGVRVLSEDVVRRFLEPAFPGQALGWQRPVLGGVGAFVHAGFTGTFVYGDTELGLGIVLLTNRQHAGVDAETAYPDVGPLQDQVVRLVTGPGR